jgi:hypothetical protein
MKKYITQNNQQKIIVIIYVIFELYKITSGNLLILFIPPTNYDELTQNMYYNLMRYINIMSLLSFIVLYIIEIKREKFMIETFEYDKTKSDDNLINLYITHQEIYNDLLQVNIQYLILYELTIMIYIINIIYSSSYIYINYLDYKIFMSIITNILLNIYKLTYGYYIAKKSYNNNQAISYYIVEKTNLCFNCLEEYNKKM